MARRSERRTVVSLSDKEIKTLTDTQKLLVWVDHSGMENHLKRVEYDLSLLMQRLTQAQGEA